MRYLFTLLVLCLFTNTAFSSNNEKKLAGIYLNKNNMSVIEIYGSPNEIEIEKIEKKSLDFISAFGKINSTPDNYDNLFWIYKYKTYTIKVSINSSSNIDSISLMGQSSPFYTSKNIKLGSNYSDVIQKYGIPNYKVEYENSIILNYNNAIEFTISKSNKVPMQDWIVKQIKINSYE